MKFGEQAKRFGAKVSSAEVRKVEGDNGNFEIATDMGNYSAKAVLVATGAAPRKLEVEGGELVHYCATCDGVLYKEKRLVCVGGGDSAVQEAIFLTRFASHIDLIVRSKIKAHGGLVRELKELEQDGKISVYEGWDPAKVIKDDSIMTGVEIRKTASGEMQVLEANGIFAFIGARAEIGFLEGVGAEIDERGLIVTDRNMMSSVGGIFASGDVRSGAVRQVAAAVGDGAKAAIGIREWLAVARGLATKQARVMAGLLRLRSQ
jgi:thioredoxin reductase (NADPH)